MQSYAWRRRHNLQKPPAPERRWQALLDPAAFVPPMTANCSKPPRWHWVSKQHPRWQILRLPLMAYLRERRYTQNYTVRLTAADGARTWQREQIWRSSFSARKANRSVQLASSGAPTAKWRALGEEERERRKTRRCIFKTWVLYI